MSEYIEKNIIKSKYDSLAIGSKFGKLTIISGPFIKKNDIRKPKSYFLCRCECNNELYVAANRIQNGIRNACISCVSSDRNRKRHRDKLELLPSLKSGEIVRHIKYGIGKVVSVWPNFEVDRVMIDNRQIYDVMFGRVIRPIRIEYLDYDTRKHSKVNV